MSTCRARFATALICTVALAGCSSSNGDQRVPFQAPLSETAEFNVFHDDQHVGTLSFGWEISGTFGHVTGVGVSFGNHGEQTSTGPRKGVFDLERGTWVSAEVGDKTVYPMLAGRHSLLAQEWQHPAGAIEPLVLAPLGLQWLLNENTDFDWTGVEIGLEPAETEWAVTAVVVCQNRCAILKSDDLTNPQQIVGFKVATTFEQGRLMPKQATIRAQGADFGEIRLERTTASVSEERVALVPPSPQIFPATLPTCNLAPCEPPGWPFFLSIQEGIGALQGTDEWQTWSAAHPGNVPTRLFVAHESATQLVLGVPAISSEWTTWHLTYGDSFGETRFSLRSDLGPAGWATPMLQSVDDVEPKEPWMRAKWPDQPAAGLDQLLIEARRGLPADVEVLAVDVLFADRTTVPESKLGASVAFLSAEGLCATIASLSALDYCLLPVS